MFKREQQFRGMGNESTFLWGARQTGKSTLLKTLFPNSMYFDLLLSSEYERLVKNPSLFRERIEALNPEGPIIVDEIQRLPVLLNEIHWLISNKNQRFILSGSSPRKILRSGTNLLGGRAMRHELYPLIYKEIPEFNLLKALNFGLLPRHYLSPNPKKLISAYIGSYLKDEIALEAKIRNMTIFSQFLEKAAFSNGEMTNYSNIASDCGISVPTVKEYFQILEDTLTGHFISSYQKKPKRRVIQAPKFYFFDLGISNYLIKRGEITEGSESFGKAFEHFIFQELIAHSHYSDLNYPIHYWRTASQIEVDFILGDVDIALEVKSSNNIQPRHLKGLKSFSEEYKVKHSILVCMEPYPRRTEEVLILPWKIFLEKMWSGEFIR
jgi:predicted AAA+ superfamily ATPase